MLQTISINNRRYLGNKFKLLEFIKRTIDCNCDNVNVFADLFAGTGSVASAFAPKCKIITNDILYSSYISQLAWFSPEPYDINKIIDYINRFNSLSTRQRNYMSIYFGDTYFSKEDCSKIGFIRDIIENDYNQSLINDHERAILITSLLYSMDNIANTCGHYDAFIKNKKFYNHLLLKLPVIDERLNPQNEIYNQDINDLAPNIYADVVYLDPPYNSRQYCDCYHLLENVAAWKKPKVYGVARKMDRTALKSKYCSHNAVNAFEQLIKSINARYIVLSYNNMGTKGHDRSNARLTDNDILAILSDKGSVSIFSQGYKAFAAGLSRIENNEERLFLCKVK